MAKKLLIIIVIILIVALVVLAIVFINPKKEGEVEEVEEVEEAEEAEEKVEPEEKGPSITEEIYGLSGEIKEIKDRTLLVEVNILLTDPMKKPLRQTVKIVTTDETRILKLKFPEEIPEGSTEPIFPEKIEISFDDLKVGDKVDIEIPDNVYEKIINNLEIVASTSIISLIE